MPKRKKQRYTLIIAGQQLSAAKWDSSPAKTTDSPSVRAKKRLPSTEARRAINARRSYEKLERVLYANFNRGNLFISVDFKDEYLPRTMKELNTFVYDNFLRKVVQMRRAAGLDTVWVKVLEGKHGDHRFHAHFIINAAKEEIAGIRALWTYGGIDIQPIQNTEHKNLSALAAYLSKESRSDQRKLGERTWTTSRNIAKPEIYHGFVDEAIALHITDNIPQDKITVEYSNGATIYGRWETVKVIFPDWFPPAESELTKKLLQLT